MSFALYQLRYRNGLTPGTYVFVDGPNDRHGKIVKALETNNEGTLYLIRGTGSRPEGYGAPEESR